MSLSCGFDRTQYAMHASNRRNRRPYDFDTARFGVCFLVSKYFLYRCVAYILDYFLKENQTCRFHSLTTLINNERKSRLSM